MGGFWAESIPVWTKWHLLPGSHGLSDGLASCRSVTTASGNHKAVVTGGKHPNDLSLVCGFIPLLGNLKISFRETHHAFNFGNNARRYLGG